MNQTPLEIQLIAALRQIYNHPHDCSGAPYMVDIAGKALADAQLLPWDTLENRRIKLGLRPKCLMCNDTGEVEAYHDETATGPVYFRCECERGRKRHDCA